MSPNKGCGNNFLCTTAILDVWDTAIIVDGQVESAREIRIFIVFKG